jgi:long-chain acyl-CoA synthetase
MTLLYNWLEKSAKARGNNKALVYRDNYLSWRGLLHRVNRRAQEFKAMGLKKGAWVGLMLGNVPDFVILALGLSKLGVTVVPIDPTTGARELELMMAAAPLRALVTRPRGSEATGGSPGTRRRENEEPEETDEEPPEIRRRLQGTLLTCSVFKTPNPDFGTDASAVMFTADSLGDPKGVLRTNANFEASVDQVVKVLSIDESSRILTAVPLFHAYGWDIGLLPTLRTGATMYLEEEISAKRVAKLLREHTIDVLPGTPTMYSELSRLPIRRPLDVENPRFLAGGAPLDPEIAQLVEESYGVKVLSCYHSTETSVVAVEMTGKHPGSVGKSIDGVEIKVVPGKGERKGSKRGVIWVRGPALSPVSIGPYKDIEAAAAKSGDVAVGAIDKDGWYRTGDVGKLDRSSRLFLLGREDDLVKVEGKRVALGEVEGCLESFPKVKEARARLESDPLNGAMVVAKVVATGKVKAEEIIDHCARNLAPYKVPRRIELVERI